MYTYVQMKKGSSEHAECLKEQILSYYKELDEQHGRKTAEDFLLSVIESTLAMQGPHDRHLEICTARWIMKDTKGLSSQAGDISWNSMSIRSIVDRASVG